MQIPADFIIVGVSDFKLENSVRPRWMRVDTSRAVTTQWITVRYNLQYTRGLTVSQFQVQSVYWFKSTSTAVTTQWITVRYNLQFNILTHLSGSSTHLPFVGKQCMTTVSIQKLNFTHFLQNNTKICVHWPPTTCSSRAKPFIDPEKIAII